MVEKDPADSALAATLKAFASASRLALLRQLREPCILSDIRLVSPEEGGSASDRDRPMARQAVRKHLGKLMEAGVVSAKPTERAFGETLEYVVNHPRIFAISEEIRELANLRPVEEPVMQPTVEDARRLVPTAQFPRLLMVRGLKEGVGFPLKPAPNASEDDWIVGRKRGVAVPVDYDPYVSLENTRIGWRRGRYFVEDLPQSRNGTTLNFERLPEGTCTDLAHGDVIGVGRTLFVFQTKASPAVKAP